MGLLGKKGREEPDRSATPTVDGNRRFPWGKKKKEQDAVPRVNLQAALPSVDNFRTSLIMPGLSARFSMLQGADDPFSKMGKASDDSIINRRSRHFATLGGISENESPSFDGPVRPPYAGLRSGSYQSEGGYATDDDSIHSGSIMSRARPGEGNMLFGGRQKIYRIPIGDAGSVNNLGGSDSRGMRGRALYEDDVSMSAFQRMREQEKQAQREAKLRELEKELDGDVSKLNFNSPAPSIFDEKRQTTSSTNSGPSTFSASTAPTSIHTQTPNQTSSPILHSPSSTLPSRPSLDKSSKNPALPSPTSTFPARPSLDKPGKTRRLYEQGLDQHMQEHQSSNMTRLNSLSRTRPPQLAASKSAHNLGTNVEKPVDDDFDLSNLPSAEGLTTFESLRDGTAPGFSTARPRNNSEGETVFVNALDSRDRGKATALGTFNRPKQFDEQQYLERQKSMMRSRSQRSNSATAASRIIAERAAKASRPSGEENRRPSAENRFRNHGRPQSPALVNTPMDAHNRFTKRGEGGTRLRSESGGSARPSTANDSAASSSPKQSLDCATPDNERTIEESQIPEEPELASPRLSFERGRPADAPAPLRHGAPPPINDHPAMRSQISSTASSPKVRRQGWAPGAAPASFAAIEAVQAATQSESAAAGKSESQTLEENSADGKGATLRGLVSNHLRHGSDQSSIYASRDSRYIPEETNSNFDLRIPSMYNSNTSPWDHDDLSMPPIPAEFQQQQAAYRAKREAMSAQTTKPTSLPSSPALPGQSQHVQDHVNDWRQELERQHTRAGSSETQAERDAFSEELAQRQRAIQENLKVKSEPERAPSPSGSASKFENPLKPFGMLRTRSSRDSIPRSATTKKAPGLGKAANDSSTSLNSSEKTLRDGQDGRKVSIGRTLHSRLPQAGEDALRQNSLTSASGRGDDNSASPPGTSHDSSRTSASRNEPTFDHSMGFTQSPTMSPDEVHGQPSTGYFDAAADTNNFPFETSGDIVEATRLRSSTSHTKAPSNATTHKMSLEQRPNIPPLITAQPPSSPPANGMMNSSAISSAPMSAMSEPYSANSTPPLSSVSSPSFRGDTNASVSSQAGFSGKSPDLTSQPFPAVSPNGFHFPVRSQETQPSKKLSRKRTPTIAKSDISEPHFISATSTVNTVALPPGANLSNGMGNDVDVVLAAQKRSMSPTNFPSPVSPFQNGKPQISHPQPMPISPASPVPYSGSGAPGTISITRMPPPPPPPPQQANSGGSFRKGFLKFGSNKTKDDELDDEWGAGLANTTTRMRIRKVSDADMTAGGRPRHRIINAEVMEKSGFI